MAIHLASLLVGAHLTCAGDTELHCNVDIPISIITFVLNVLCIVEGYFTPSCNMASVPNHS